ncbi:MAG TPA: response regulator transcription factor [Acidimicrobiia bacterium]
MRVVIADDHRIVREGLAYMLSDHDGIDIVGEAESGEALLELLAEVDTDVVLLDIRMPGMSGLDTLEVLTEKHPDVRVVMLTMHDDATFVRRAIEGGASGYLLKSAAPAEVIRALEAVEAGQAYIQPEVTGPLLAGIVGSDEDTTLAPRQQEVLQLVAEGLENKQIARRLDISEATVKTYLKNVFEILEARGRAEAVAIALRRGLIQ